MPPPAAISRAAADRPFSGLRGSCCDESLDDLAHPADGVLEHFFDPLQRYAADACASASGVIYDHCDRRVCQLDLACQGRLGHPGHADDVAGILLLERPRVGAAVHSVGCNRVAEAVAREEHHRYAAYRAESEGAGRLLVGGTHYLATRDIEIGELCQPGATDDCEHVHSGIFDCVDFRQIAPGPGHVHSAAEHVAVGQLQTDEIGDDGFVPADVLVGEHGAVERGRAERVHAIA